MISPRVHFKVENLSATDDHGEYLEDNRVEAPEHEANIISSRLENDMHAPTLDIDLPCKLIPSSTPGHFHLYIDKEMTWSQYCKLLWGLREAGVIEGGYYNASMKRGATFLRKPGVSK